MKPNNAIRKVAIFVASLDDRTADAVLDQMNPQQAAQVRQALVELVEIDPAEQRQIIDEFRSAGLGGTAVKNRPAADEYDDGVELDASLAERFSQADEASHAKTAIAAPEPLQPPFTYLHNADSQTLVRYLEREHPQMIALVVSHLPSRISAEVVDTLPMDLQVEVIRRLANLDETDPQIVHDIDRSLQKWWDEQSREKRRRDAGLANVSAILGSIGQKARNQILSNLAQHDQGLASRLDPHGEVHIAPRTSVPANNAPRIQPATVLPIRRAKVTFAELCKMDHRRLSEVISAAESEVLILALTGADSRFVDRVLHCLPSPRAKLVRKALTHVGPTRLSDVEDAQTQLCEIAAEISSPSTVQRNANRRVAMAA
ncbi:MAG: FliG C-terminal domain-containing protein [Planctomycetota bacterium]|nr:FliG C-terminal domain-containing protein [Planctomycetota bacterium]